MYPSKAVVVLSACKIDVNGHKSLTIPGLTFGDIDINRDGVIDSKELVEAIETKEPLALSSSE